MNAAVRSQSTLQYIAPYLMRLGLFAAAFIAFEAASSLWETGNPLSNRFSMGLMLANFIAAFCALLLAADSRYSRHVIWVIPITYALVIASHAQVSEVIRLHFDSPQTSDGQMLADYAARLLWQGQNPYTANLSDLFRVYQVPSTFSTPLIEGGFVSRVAYPALSFLPFAVAQALSIDTRWVYPVFLIASLLLVYRTAPAELRPVILLPFFIDTRVLSYVLGGVGDIVWVFFLLLCIANWEKRGQSALWFGLACATKQQPWFLLPYLIIRLWHEQPGPATERIRGIGRFLIVAGLVFLLVNGPFILWSPGAWLTGVLDPLSANMVQLSQGLSSLNMAGLTVIPKGLFLLFQGLMLIVSMTFYAVTFPRFRQAMWFFPMVVLWVGFRALSSYWYFLSMPFAFAILCDLATSEVLAPRSERTLAARLLLPAGVVSAIFIAGSVLFFRGEAAVLQIQTTAPIEVSGDRGMRAYVQVTNPTSSPIEPQFSVQSWSGQPLIWQIEAGPARLEAGTSASYTISSRQPTETVEMVRGGQIMVYDRSRYDTRTSLVIPADTALHHPDAIPNGDFQYRNAQSAVPAFWERVLPDSDHSEIVYESDEVLGNVLAFNLSPENTDPITAKLETEIAYSPLPINVWVNRPVGANQFPDPDLVYGVELETQGQIVWVLFGDEADSGELAPDLFYWMQPAPEGEWSQQRIAPQTIFETLGLTIQPSLDTPLRRFEHLDIPMAPLQVRLMFATRGNRQPQSARFGPIHTLGTDAAPGTLIHSGPDQAGWAQVWYGAYLERDNAPALARVVYEQVEPQSAAAREAFTRAATLALSEGDDEAAIQWFQRAIDLGTPPPTLYLALGRAYADQDNNVAALAAFEQAERLTSETPGLLTIPELVRLYDAMGALYLSERRCFEAKIYYEQARTRDPNWQIPLDQLNTCTPES